MSPPSSLFIEMKNIENLFLSGTSDVLALNLDLHSSSVFGEFPLGVTTYATTK